MEEELKNLFQNGKELEFPFHSNLDQRHCCDSKLWNSIDSALAESAHSTFLKHYRTFSSWHFEQSHPFPLLAMWTELALVTCAAGLETTQVPQRKNQPVEAPASEPLTNAPANPTQWRKQMIQRSDGSCCYPEKQSSEATMVSPLLPPVYLV